MGYLGLLCVWVWLWMVLGGVIWFGGIVVSDPLLGLRGLVIGFHEV